MRITERDTDPIKLVAEYRQVTATQIRRLIFPDVSAVMMSRVLRRLVAAGLLRRVGRLAAGDDGGSGPFVYQPGIAGWRLAGKTKRDYSAIHHHFVWVAEAFTELVEAQRRGELCFRPELEIVVGQARADMRLAAWLPGEPEPTYYYLEVEVFDKKSNQYIRDKLAAYVRAWDASVGGFPYVVVCAPTEHHKLKIEAIAEEFGEDAELFKVCVVAGLVGTLTTR
jgi:hypothetical protein